MSSCYCLTSSYNDEQAYSCVLSTPALVYCTCMAIHKPSIQCSTAVLVCAADITANPAITSVAILGVLALALSPYVLIIGGIALVFSAASLPGPLKKLLPAPVVEVTQARDLLPSSTVSQRHQLLTVCKFRQSDLVCIAACL